MICFCAVDMVVTIPITIGLVTAALVDTEGKLKPYSSWAAVHYDFGTVLQISASELETFSVQRSRIDLGRWVAPISAFLFFGILGLTNEARSEYRRLALSAWPWGDKKQKERPAVLVQVQRYVDELEIRSREGVMTIPSPSRPTDRQGRIMGCLMPMPPTRPKVLRCIRSSSDGLVDAHGQG